jgi:predicted ATP-grasp superfamily ATP-dependent carboligase
MPDHLIIIGASVRAAAFSAIRAGLRPWCVDLFADRDLAAVCPARRVPMKGYPRALFQAVDDAPPGPWMYTGGLENYPDLIDDLARRRPLWGNPGSVLRRVRDPFLLREVLTAAGCDVPECRPTPEGLPTDGSWLVKPRRGGGGRGIAKWTGQKLRRPIEQCCFQKLVAGTPVSAVFCGSDHAVATLGVYQQYIGAFHAPPWAYCGSVGPLDISEQLEKRVDKAVIALRTQFDLRGLCGLDGVVRDGRLNVVEVNPRYTASVELAEAALKLKALRMHRAGCTGRTMTLPRRPVRPVLQAKIVLHAPEDWVMPDTDVWMKPHKRDRSVFADVPGTGEKIRKGNPVMSLLTSQKYYPELLDWRLDLHVEEITEYVRAAQPAAASP